MTLFTLTALSEPGRSRASEIYSLCGPESTGFIRAGRQTGCVGGSLDWRRRGSRASSPVQSASPPKTREDERAVSGGSNKNVDDDLNQADIQFRDGKKDLACRWVGNAIGAANSDYGGPASANQKEQLKEYARRCDLRY